MIKIRNGDTGQLFPFKVTNFPGGELHPVFGDIEANGSSTFITIEAYLYKPEDIVELLMVHDALRRKYMFTPFKLLCPYLPYARQDRVANTGEALSVKVMCDLINWMHFETVEVWDVHSDVALALLDRVVNITPKGWLSRANIDWKNTILVAPDAGAQKKVQSLAKVFDCEMITATKVRDTKTGEITETSVNISGKKSKSFLIVDDICDGGRTFVTLARLLNPLTFGNIGLYVTHGIFSNGFEDLTTDIGIIMCPHIWPDIDKGYQNILRRLT